MGRIKQFKLLLVITMLTAVSAMLQSCYPDYGLGIEDFDIVATFKDDAANFQGYRTFFLPDSIHEIREGGLIVSSDGQYDDEILSTISNEMEANGYTRVSTPEQADVQLYVGRSSSSTFTYYPGYWWGYYGWYYPWYGGYYYSYSTGSLFVTMMDPDKFNEPQQIVGAVWAGAANGVLDSSTDANIAARTMDSIHQMFEQSPYLRLQ